MAHWTNFVKCIIGASVMIFNLEKNVKVFTENMLNKIS
jgi:hypothetical protein